MISLEIFNIFSIKAVKVTGKVTKVEGSEQNTNDIFTLKN